MTALFTLSVFLLLVGGFVGWLFGSTLAGFCVGAFLIAGVVIFLGDSR